MLRSFPFPMDNLPVYSSDLVKKLDQMYPSKCPDLTTPDREIWFKAGQRAVVDFLLTRLKLEQELPQVLSKD